jgi:cytochrome P450
VSAPIVTETSRRVGPRARARTHRGLPRPPGPRGFPGLGAVLDFQRDPLAAFSRYAREYGDVVYLDLAGTPTYVFAHPDDVQSVLIGEHAHMMKDELTHELSRFMGRGLVTSEGAFWRRQRKTAAPSFQRHHIGKFADTMVDATCARLDGFHDGVRDVHTDMMIVTLDIVLRTMFGAETLPDTEAVGEMVETMTVGFGETYLTWRRLVPRALRPTAHARLDEARARLDDIIYPMIERKRATADEGDDLLSRLLAARDDRGHRMTDEQVRDEVATVFLAGHETTALALSYALWLLARAPQLQARAREEVDAAVGRRRATLDDVPNLRFCDAVIKEAMRLYPPVYLVGREALCDVEIGGWPIPRGAQILSPQWLAHRDERWFSEPLAFQPERWLDGLEKRLHRFAYFPFGGGARVCVGNYFASLEAVLVLATILQRVEVAPHAPHRLRLRPSVTLRPETGVELVVTRRPAA